MDNDRFARTIKNARLKKRVHSKSTCRFTKCQQQNN